jgi:hypothetical protein
VVRVTPNNLTTTSVAAGDLVFQLLPRTEMDTSVPSAPYTVKLGGLIVEKGTSGPDGVVKLPFVLGSTVTVDIAGISFDVTIDQSPNLRALDQATLPSWSGVPFGLGIGLHSLAFNDLSWLRSANSRAYWSPLIPNFGIPLERSLNELPRDLSPKLQAYLSTLKPGDQGAWISEAGPIEFKPDPGSAETAIFTAENMRSIEGLVAKYNASPSSLSPSELQLLREAVRIHLGGATRNAPLVSYSQPGTVVSWTGRLAYRVRTRVSRSQAIDISKPNEFNLGHPDITNVSEAEVMVVGDQAGNIVSVIPAKALGDGGWVYRNAESIRWGGRLVIVGGFAYSAYRVNAAPPEQRTHVLGEEVGGQAGGFGGAAVGASACIAFGVATDGVGLFLCGLVGGATGGAIGSAGGGAAADAVSDWLTDAAWKALHHSAEQQGDIPPPALDGVGDDILGDPVIP